MQTDQVPAAACWHCGTVNDAATNPFDRARPSAGAISICLRCGCLSMFGEDLRLERIPKAILDDIAKDRVAMNELMNVWWARNQVLDPWTDSPWKGVPT